MKQPSANFVNQLPVRVFAVVVLYKMQPGESTAFRTLQASISSLQNELGNITIMLYDNTPGGQEIGFLPAGVQYKADPQNGGLATAYNYALEIADKEGFDWLLTLDQDTSLPIDFLCKLCHAAAFVATMPSVAAIVPRISSDGRVLSPFTLMKRWTLTKNIPDGFVGIPLENVYAVNSASTIKVSALKAVGGYDPRFHLDYSDLAIYHRLHCQKLRAFVAGNIHVEHVVSGYDLKKRSTPGRYEEFCRAEEEAYDEWMGGVARVVLAVRLFHRLVYRLWRNNGSLPYFKIVFRFLCRRLFYSRKSRLDSRRRSIGLRTDV